MIRFNIDEGIVPKTHFSVENGVVTRIITEQSASA